MEELARREIQVGRGLLDNGKGGGPGAPLLLLLPGRLPLLNTLFFGGGGGGGFFAAAAAIGLDSGEA